MHIGAKRMDNPINLSSCHCLSMRKAARHLAKIYDHHLAVVGITNVQFSILAILKAYPKSSIIELGQFLDMDRTTLIRTLKPLQRDELIEVGVNSLNARQYVYSLSMIGEQKYSDSRIHWQNAQHEFAEQFGQERATQLRQLLLQVGQ